MIVELHGLEVPGRHGVLEEERERDRVFLFDIAFDVIMPKGPLDALFGY